MKCIQCNKISSIEELLDYNANSYVYSYYTHKYDDKCDEVIFVCEDCIQEVYDNIIIQVMKIKLNLK